MKIAIILAMAAIAANIILIWYAKKCSKAKTVESSNSKLGPLAFSKSYLNTPDVKQLRTSTAAELGLSVEELDRMLAKEIKQIAKEQKSINIE